MDGKDDIQAKMTATSERFDKVIADKNSLEQELYRLQGEYRLLEELLNKFPADKKADKKSKISPNAETLDVRSVKGA